MWSWAEPAKEPLGAELRFVEDTKMSRIDVTGGYRLSLAQSTESGRAEPAYEPCGAELRLGEDPKMNRAEGQDIRRLANGSRENKESGRAQAEDNLKVSNFPIPVCPPRKVTPEPKKNQSLSSEWTRHTAV